MFYIWQHVRRAWQRGQSTHDFAAEVLVGTAEKLDAHDDALTLWESLTTRQRQITALVCLGYTYPQIAAKLHLSVPTVKTHVQNIFQKFGLSRRYELVNLLSAWDFREGDESEDPQTWG